MYNHEEYMAQGKRLRHRTTATLTSLREVSVVQAQKPHACGDGAARRPSACRSFDRHALGEVSGLVHIRSARHCGVVGQQLQRHDVQEG